jgi:ribosomal protein L29
MKKAKLTPDMLADKTEALRKFRFNIAGSKNKNIREGRAIRRDIARINTMNTANNNGK